MSQFDVDFFTVVISQNLIEHYMNLNISSMHHKIYSLVEANPEQCTTKLEVKHTK